MRSSFLISALGVLAFAACGQSLNGDKTGTGGRGGETGGTGGWTTPGTGGSTGSATCEAIAAQYQAAVYAGQSCTVGVPGQCQQTAPPLLEICGTCPTYLNDASKLGAIQKTWYAAGCNLLDGVTPPCVLPQCPAISSGCIATDAGEGICAITVGAGGTGGSTTGAGGAIGTGGAPGDAGVIECGALATQYAAVLAASKSCDVGTTGQCSQEVFATLSPCKSGCMDYVNDATQLNTIRGLWDQAGCGNVDVLCPAIACATPSGSMCVPGDAGNGTCSVTYNAAVAP